MYKPLWYIGIDPKQSQRSNNISIRLTNQLTDQSISQSIKQSTHPNNQLIKVDQLSSLIQRINQSTKRSINYMAKLLDRSILLINKSAESINQFTEPSVNQTVNQSTGQLTWSINSSNQWVSRHDQSIQWICQSINQSINVIDQQINWINRTIGQPNSINLISEPINHASELN